MNYVNVVVVILVAVITAVFVILAIPFVASFIVFPCFFLSCSLKT